MLRAIIWIEMKLCCRVTVYVTVETRNPQTRIYRFAIVSGIELLLGERKNQPAQPVELNRCQKILKEPEKIIDRHHFPT
jgi:hypothetical protein